MDISIHIKKKEIKFKKSKKLSQKENIRPR